MSCVRICMLCSFLFLWISCRYCNLLSAQLCSLFLSSYWPNNGRGATNVLQSDRRGILLVKCSLYLSSKFVGKFGGNDVVEIWLIEGFEGSDGVSGNDRDVSGEISTGIFTKFGSPWAKACVIQCGKRCVELGWLKGFSRFCSDVGVDPK